MRRVIPGLKKLTQLKPETLAAVLTFLFVLMILIGDIIYLFFKEESDSEFWRDIPIIVLLNFVIPIVVYFGVKILLAPPKSPFPQIDLAFEAGLKALEKNGISIRETPLYLVVGMPESKRIKQMMGASRRTFDFTHVTADGQALYWYGSADSTYLFLSGVGNVSQLTKDLAKYISQSSGDSGYASGDGYKGTINVAVLGKGKPGLNLASDDEDQMADGGDIIKATIKAGDLKKSDPKPLNRAAPEPKRQQKQQLSSREKLADQKRRIAHLSTLLARHRRPVCSLNGIIVAIANRLVEEFPSELARQIKSDLTTISETTGVVCTVTAIVTGFENDQGCRQFVARLREAHGEEFLSRRFGKSYRSWESPTEEHLKEISNESIENFDQYIYSIFTQHDALSSRNVDGNRDMVKFLCWIYSRFFEGLELTMTSGFNADGKGGENLPRFAGCYFMGVGDSPEYQFFGEGVFDRVDENQGELEWSTKVTDREEALALMSQLIFLVGLIALAILMFFLFREWFGGFGDS